jgi:hypothetical protein
VVIPGGFGIAVIGHSSFDTGVDELDNSRPQA